MKRIINKQNINKTHFRRKGVPETVVTLPNGKPDLPDLANIQLWIALVEREIPFP